MDLRTLTITTDRLVIASVTAADEAETFAEVTPNLTRYMTFDPSPSLEAFASQTPEWLAEMAAGGSWHGTIRLAGTGEFLGRTGLHGIGNATPETGIWIKETARLAGYGREAVAGVAAWAVRTLGVAGLRYRVAEPNLPSRRLVEGLGARPIDTGILKKASGIEYAEIVYLVPGPS